MSYRELYETMCQTIDNVLGEGARYKAEAVVGLSIGNLLRAQACLQEGRYGELDEILTVLREHATVTVASAMAREGQSLDVQAMLQRIEESTPDHHGGALTQEELDALLQDT